MQNIEQERHSWIKLILIFSWLFLFGFLSIRASSEGPEINLNDADMRGVFYFTQVVLVIILFIAPAVLISAFWTKPGIRYLGITAKPALSTLLVASLGILLGLPVINWLAQLNEEMHLPSALQGLEEWMRKSEARATEMTELFTKGTSLSGLFMNLFVVAFMAALSEELFFRGLLQNVLTECFKNKHIAIWIGAICFSAFHMQFFGFLPRMLMGAYLGYLFMWSGSLWPGLVAHFINNGMAVFLIWLSNRGVISADIDKTGMESDQGIHVLTSAVMVTISLLLVYRIERKRKSIITIEDGNNTI